MCKGVQYACKLNIEDNHIIERRKREHEKKSVR